MKESKDDDWFIQNKGAELGKGGARTAFECKSNPELIIKEVHMPFPGANFVGFFIWNHVSSTDLAELFAEVTAISTSGKFIAMERCNSLEGGAAGTPVMPDWVRDLWANNFGRNAAGQIKCRDYANVNLSEALAAADRYPREWQRKP
jgi:hypothetical protein